MVPEIWSATVRFFFVILGNFLPYYLPNNPENQNFEKMKKHLEISFYTSVPKIIIICHTVPEIWHVMDVIFIVILGYFLPFYSSKKTPKSKFLKNKKKHLEISSFSTCVPKIVIT